MPTLIGDVGLNTRSMLMNRAGRPRSLISAAERHPIAPRRAEPARRASAGDRSGSAPAASIEEAPGEAPGNR